MLLNYHEQSTPTPTCGKYAVRMHYIILHMLLNYHEQRDKTKVRL